MRQRENISLFERQNLVHCADVPSMTKLCLIMLFGFAGQDGVCWPTLDRIACQMGASKRTAQRHMDALISAGLVHVLSEGSHHSPRRYAIDFVALESVQVRRDAKAPDEDENRGDNLSPHPPECQTDDSDRGDNLSPHGTDRDDTGVTPQHDEGCHQCPSGVTPVTNRGDTGVTLNKTVNYQRTSPPTPPGGSEGDSAEDWPEDIRQLAEAIVSAYPPTPHTTRHRAVEAALGAIRDERLRIDGMSAQAILLATQLMAADAKGSKIRPAQRWLAERGYEAYREQAERELAVKRAAAARAAEERAEQARRARHRAELDRLSALPDADLQRLRDALMARLDPDIARFAKDWPLRADDGRVHAKLAGLLIEDLQEAQ